MNRLAVIRRLLGNRTAPAPKPMGMHATQHPAEKTKRKKPGIHWIEPRPSRVQLLASRNWKSEDAKDWVMQPDSKPVKTLQHKRGHRPNPVAEIARKTVHKLPVLTFCPKTRRRL